MHRAQAFRWFAAVLASVLGSLAAAQAPARISFANLPKGDTLVISYHQPQCFGYYGAKLSYTARNAQEFVVDRISLRNPIRSADGYLHTRLGRVRLEPGEAAKLDAFIDFCRSPDPKAEDMLYFSPGPPWFRLEQKRGGKVIAEETLRYPSKMYPQERALTFDEMLRALETAFSESARGD